MLTPVHVAGGGGAISYACGGIASPRDGAGRHHAAVMANAMENPRATTIWSMLPCGSSRGGGGGDAVISLTAFSFVEGTTIRAKHGTASTADGASPVARTWETKTMRPVMETLRSISRQSLPDRGAREDPHAGRPRARRRAPVEKVHPVLSVRRAEHTGQSERFRRRPGSERIRFRFDMTRMVRNHAGRRGRRTCSRPRGTRSAGRPRCSGCPARHTKICADSVLIILR